MPSQEFPIWVTPAITSEKGPEQGNLRASQFHLHAAEFHTLVEFQVHAAVSFVGGYLVAFHALMGSLEYATT